jgi:A nuclease family of the HNH/ENDO VII superfamily with conserved AHH
MTELAEPIAIGMLAEEIEADCPFSDPALGVDDLEGEDISKDDAPAATATQENDGGVLGKNMVSGSPGKDGTVGGPCPPPKMKADARLDTARTGLRVRVPATAAIAEDVYGFTVAAHHLIPGDAALKPSKLKALMTQGESVEVVVAGGAKKNKKIRKHIGYNVNGSHNGVWLPGNYYIRGTTSPISGKSWSDLGNDSWCLNYVAAVSMAAGGQIHDAHTEYSDAVKELLNKIAAVLVQHECEKCQAPDINPPFIVKARLYSLSGFFKSQVTAGPMAWKRPWFTSDRWRKDAFSGGKPSVGFMTAYHDGGLVGVALT